jgi:hypothetical protein
MPRKVSAPRYALIAEVRVVIGAERAAELLGSDDARADRRIERWRHDGLGPLSDTGPREDAPHYAALSELAGRGLTDDTTALRLAQRGFGSRRYGEVLWRTWELDRAKFAPADPYGAGEDQALDLGAALVEQLDEPEHGPLDRIFRGMLANVRRRSAGERQVEAAAGDVAALAMGGLPIEADNPTGSPWPHTSPSVSPWTLPPGPSPLRQTATVVEHYLPEVVATVPVSIEAVRFLTRSSNARLTDDEIGDLGTLLAPLELLYLRRRLAALGAWGRTGGAWQVDYASSTPQFAMAADIVRPEDDADLAPTEAGTLVVDIGGLPDGPREERLVVRRP